MFYQDYFLATYIIVQCLKWRGSANVLTIAMKLIISHKLLFFKLQIKLYESLLQKGHTQDRSVTQKIHVTDIY